MTTIYLTDETGKLTAETIAGFVEKKLNNTN